MWLYETALVLGIRAIWLGPSPPPPPPPPPSNSVKDTRTVFYYPPSQLPRPSCSKKKNKKRNGSLMSKPDVKWPLLEIEWETGSRNQNRESLGSVRETGPGGTHTYSPPPPLDRKKNAPLQLWLFLQPGSPLNCSDAAVVLVFARILSLQTIPSAFAVLIRSQLLAGCGNRPINNENTYCPWKPLGCPVLGNEQEVERQPREDDDECVERTHGLAHDRRNGEVRWGPEHQDGNKEPNLYGRKTEWLTLSLPSAKTTFCLPSKRNVWVKWSSENWYIIIFHLSKLWKAKVFTLCDVIFLVRLQRKFEIDHMRKLWFISSAGEVAAPSQLAAPVVFRICISPFTLKFYWHVSSYKPIMALIG